MQGLISLLSAHAAPSILRATFLCLSDLPNPLKDAASCLNLGVKFVLSVFGSLSDLLTWDVEDTWLKMWDRVSSGSSSPAIFPRRLVLS